jgi:3D (Asp-Asp-Asp) domain-containing protein
MGGAFQMDRVIQNTAGAANEMAFQAEQKIKATANFFHNLVINGTGDAEGDGYVTGTFDGLKKLLTGTCTAYTDDEGDSGSWTSTGKHVAVGLVAVDPRVIPYGTKMWITSADGSMVYGYAIAADTGGALRSGRVLVDLFMDTLTECNAFGRRSMNVYILE